MSAFWHPLSAVYLREPRAMASPVVVRLMLESEGRADLVYAGDRMWPALRHGQDIDVRPLGGEGPRAGEVVLVLDGGVLDVVRVRVDGEKLLATGDADPAAPRRLVRGDVVGRLDLLDRSARFPSAWVRSWLDVIEAIHGAPESSEDPAGTVRTKYDDQAPHYARLDGDPLDAGLQASLRQRLAAGARILVAGSGAGREVFALEELGYEPIGVDFSSRMVDVARECGARRHSRASFTASDLRAHDEPSASLDAILFTYDVYSFVPRSEARVSLLRSMREWLRPRGWLLLSARRSHGVRDVATLTLQRIVHGANRRNAEWGDSHTRWLDGGGQLRRSFVHVFSERQLDAEAAAAGFRRESWHGGHGLYAPDSRPRPQADA